MVSASNNLPPAGIELSPLSGEAAEPEPLKPEQRGAFRLEVEDFAPKAGLHFNSPPFALPEELDPAALGKTLAETFYHLERIEGPVLSLLWREMMRDVEPVAEPLAAAGEMIAADFDRGIGAGRMNAYHNRQHTAEVLIVANLLALLAARNETVEPEARPTLLLAALVHDWAHDGTTNAGIPFRLETRSLMRARPYFMAAHIRPALINRIDLMVRTTDTGGAHEFARRALDWHIARIGAGDGPQPAPPEVPHGLEPLVPLILPDEGESAELAAMLRDADILPSAGLTADYAVLQNSRLADEWAQPITPDDYRALLNRVLGRERRPTDHAAPQPYEDEGRLVSFASQEGQFFNSNIPAIAASVMDEQQIAADEAAAAEAVVEEQGIDFSMLTETKAAVAATAPPDITAEEIESLRAAMKESGYFEVPPFTLDPKHLEKFFPAIVPHSFNLAEGTADSLMRLHGISGPVVSVVVSEAMKASGIKADDPFLKAALGIAKEIDLGRGAGFANDDPSAERHPYHNKNHILDLVGLAHMLNLRAFQRGATASSPLAQAMLLLAALLCHWHHGPGGNTVNGEYIPFHQQDHSLNKADPWLAEIPTDLALALQAVVRATDPRDPFVFSRQVYTFHIGLTPKPQVPESCLPIGSILSDMGLATVAARLNDAIYAPFVGLTPAYSARSMVELGRELGLPIDFAFLRKNLIGPMLSRPLLPGEHPPAALLLTKDRMASFTSAEAQAIFNPNLHAIMAAQLRA